MKKSKIVFLLMAGMFLLIMIYLAYDISSRTTWPGAKPPTDTLELTIDTLKVDSVDSVIDSSGSAY